MNCVTTSEMKVMWNGSLTEAFQPSRGLRQGDPLSPYLFVLCIERLSHLINAATNSDHWRPIRASEGGPPLTHLFFADDLVLFGEASVHQAAVINSCLDLFCTVFGQKVSLPKSRVLFSRAVDDTLANDVSTALGIPVIDDLGTYLGMPTLSGRVIKETYQHIVSKVNSRLSGWQAKYLSLAGRITLTQSVLSCLLFYSMQSALLPRSICDTIDKKCRGFIWGSTNEQRRIHLVGWDKTCRPKDEGGLGIRSMRQANTAFLSKLGWRVLNEPTSLWSRVVTPRIH